MDDDAKPEPAGGSGPASAGPDEALLAACADDLVDAVSSHLGQWVVRCVTTVAEAWEPGSSAALAAPAQAAGERAVAAVVPPLAALLATDVDRQATNPLAILRAAVAFPTEVLAGAGVPPVARDDFDARAFPDDPYGLTPASFAEVHPALTDPGVAWGAAKAHVVLRRRRAEGRR